tara:strand:- start:7143 stop:7535 length:393 start_codon:yes stop_codon:yes gene_type:complete
MIIELTESKCVYVDPNNLSGGYPNVEVNKGEVYDFKVNELSRWRRKWISSNADGAFLSFVPSDKRIVQKTRYLKLCGKVGMDSVQGFPIGLYREKFEIKEDGILYLFANRRVDDEVEASGYLVVEITRVS